MGGRRREGGGRGGGEEEGKEDPREGVGGAWLRGSERIKAWPSHGPQNLPE